MPCTPLFNLVIKNMNEELIRWEYLKSKIPELKDSAYDIPKFIDDLSKNGEWIKVKSNDKSND